MSNFGYYNEQIGYYEGDRQGADKIVPLKPSPRDEHKLVSLEIENADGTFGAWEHDATLPLKALGKIPTNTFIATVFAPPAGMVNPPSDYTWNREAMVRFISPAISARLPKDGNISGTRAEIEQMAGWLLTFKHVTNTFPPVFEACAPGDGVLHPEEYGRVAVLLDAYGVQ